MKDEIPVQIVQLVKNFDTENSDYYFTCRQEIE